TTLASDQQRFRRQYTDTPGPSGSRNRQTLERRVIAYVVRRLAVGDLPDDVALVQIDPGDTSPWWIHHRHPHYRPTSPPFSPPAPRRPPAPPAPPPAAAAAGGAGGRAAPSTHSISERVPPGTSPIGAICVFEKT